MVVGLLLNGVRIAQASTQTRVLVVPFKVNAGSDLGFLQRGITDMLVSRLESASEVIVISADQAGDDIAALARKEKATYVVTGSLTVLGDRVSTDARVFEGQKLDHAVLSFGRIGRRQDDVIDHIDELATLIKTRLLGQSTLPSSPSTSPLPAPEPTPSTSVSTQAPMVGQSHVAGQHTSTLVPLQTPGIGEFKEQLNGLAAGDIDGDGAADIVTIGKSRLYIHQWKQSRWVKLSEYKGTGDFVGVDTADLNHNGRSEVFVTSFDNTESRVNSFVLEWNGGTLRRVAERLPWYFRAVDIAQSGKVLVGQRQGMDAPFATGIYKMVWQADTYSPGDRLVLPAALNIFGFAQGTVRSQGKAEAVVYDSDGYIQILNRSGEEAWVSADRYGGGANAIVFTDEEQWDAQKYIYLSPRIHLHDLDGDGIQEILAVKNEASFGSGVLSRQRNYAKGRLEWLKWHGQGIRSTMQTLDMTRFISDSAMVDLDNDGHFEIVAAVVKKKRGLTSKGSSYLTMFKIDPGR